MNIKTHLLKSMYVYSTMLVSWSLVPFLFYFGQQGEKRSGTLALRILFTAPLRSDWLVLISEALCTYLCNAPLPEVWAEVGKYGDLHFWKLQSLRGSVLDDNIEGRYFPYAWVTCCYMYDGYQPLSASHSISDLFQNSVIIQSFVVLRSW